MKRLIIFATIILLVTSTGVYSNDTFDSNCDVVGGGAISPGDHFGMNVKHMKDGSLRGSLSVHTPYGYRFKSTSFIALGCQRDGGTDAAPPDAAQLSRSRGTGRWNGEDGYFFIVFTEDRGEAGVDGGEIDYLDVRIFSSLEPPVVVYRSAGFVTLGNVQHLPVHE